METLNFELLFSDRRPNEQQVAHVRVKPRENPRHSGTKAGSLLSSPCHNMVEMDAEIRRLHAELDEIRAQARKRFYKAQAAMVGV